MGYPIGLVLTKFTTTITRIGCNLCDSSNIAWKDEEDNNHLCYECMESQRDKYLDHGDQN